MLEDAVLPTLFSIPVLINTLRPPARREQGEERKIYDIGQEDIVMEQLRNKQEMKKSLPSPFPAPLKTAPIQNAQPMQAATPVQNVQPTQATAQMQTAMSAQNVQPVQAAAPVQNAQPMQATAQMQAAMPIQNNIQPAYNTQANQNNMQPQAAPIQPYSIFAKASTYNYLAGGDFMKNIAFFSKYKNRYTGYSNMDNIQPFIPGLYTIGAVPSLGKTTGIWQLANQLAAMNEYVLYFSLEQTKFELMSKSISHRFYQEYEEDAAKNNGQSSLPLYTSMQIRYGDANSAEVQNMVSAQMQEIQERLYIFDGAFSCTVEDICFQVEEFIRQTGQVPVVIIDYLQIIQASTRNGKALDTKENIDHIVKTLKQLQMKHNATIIVISSLNRQNYTTPVDLESYKESGNIEYTSDVVWGLQLSVLNAPEFSNHYDQNGNQKKETTTAEKRNMINQARLETPRSLQMTYLKNRFGAAGQSVFFDYIPAYETFIPRDSDTP